MAKKNIHHYLSGSEGIITTEAGNAQDILFVTSNDRIEEVADILKCFKPFSNILPFPAYDVLPFERISPSATIINLRLATLAALINNANDNHNIIVTSIDALKRKILPKSIISQNYINVCKGDKLDRHYLMNKLITLGFSRLVNACNGSEFAVRGSIIDIVFDESQPGYRIDFYGSNVDSIRTFDTVTQKSIESIDNIFFHPCNEVIINDQTLKYFTDNLRTSFGLKANTLIETFTHHRKTPGQENLLPFFYGQLESLFDYLNSNTQIFYSYDTEIIAKQIDKNIEKLHLQCQDFKSNTNGENSFFPIPNIESLYLDTKAIVNKIIQFDSTELNPFSENKLFTRPKNFHNESKAILDSSINLFKRDLDNNINCKTIIAFATNGSRQRLKNLLNEYEIINEEINNYDDFKKLKDRIVGLLCLQIEEGIEYKALGSPGGPSLRIFTEQELLGEKFGRKLKQKKFSGNVFTELASFQEGELVVHIEHGIGRFEGLQTLTVHNVAHDFAKLIYADGDKLYLPVENLDLMSRFGSSDDIALDKLGSINWQMRKAKLKNKIKIAAESLLKIAAERAVIKADVLIPIEAMYEEFLSKFPYAETEDQLKAIDDVTKDLASGKPMDRLVCGDVGFGKTEVALRAVFMAVANLNPCQVAILVPTTLLSRQHYATFTKRFESFPIRIEQLSKFTTGNKAKLIKQNLEQGTVDVVIGTHALLAKTIKFKNLGLIIIDEEQHFGVGQKERLKEIKSHAHVLTLSATPIPRTLQLSLTGIKDLSIIASPPTDRLPIKTFVIPNDYLTIREAILREYYRGGRIFYVTPRTSYLDSILDVLKEIVPDIKAQKAHGKLSAPELDKIMNDFYDGKFSILVCTTIVESGLDIPNANTIIIDRAHMFGLSQLYQIRGRVGRANTQSFAYLTYPEQSKLSVIAEKRLQILSSFENLGAGFSIASHDMDLRGYGNLVGDEQSGHVKEVGIELYQHMLEDAIKNLKNDEVTESQNLESSSDIWSPVLNLKISVQIPHTYIPDVSLRLSLYRRIASIDNQEALESFAAELIDRFGTLPIEAEHLITIVKLKQLAKEAMIEKLEVGEKGILVTFRNNQPKYPVSVMNYINQNIGSVKMRPENKLLILGKFSDDTQVINCVENILKFLSK